MLENALSALIADPKWNAFAELIEKEAESSEKKVIASVMEWKPDVEQAYRAKFLREALSIPSNALKAAKLNANKTAR